MEQLPVVISDKPVLHRADTQGVVVSRIQVIEYNGERSQVQFWIDWNSGRLHHVSSSPL